MSKLLKRAWRLSNREAEKLLWYFVRSGDHRRHDLRAISDAEVRRILEDEGYPWCRTVKELRQDCRRPVPHLENLVLGSVTIESVPGIVVAHRWVVDGVELPQWPVFSGMNLELDYRTKFREACAARERCIEHGALADMLTLVTSAYGAIESFMTLRAFVYNAGVGAGQQLEDTMAHPVSLRDKIRNWLPLMSGSSINFGASPSWTVFLKWETIRHDRAIHPKMHMPPLSVEDMAGIINEFRDVAGLMFTLQRAFDPSIPSDVLRSMVYPAITVEEQTDTSAK